MFHNFGDVVQDVSGYYRRGGRANAVFVGANPRNDLRLEGTYAAVERWHITGGVEAWEVVRTDEDWSLVFTWERKSEILATSEVEIVWEIEGDAQPGLYRLRYYGDAKSIGGKITPFEATSRVFTVTL